MQLQQQQAARFMVVLIGAAAFLLLPAAADASLAIRVHLDENVLEVFDGEELVITYPVSVGKPTHPTPEGSYEIERIIWNPGWVPPPSPWARGLQPTPPGHPRNPMKKVKIFFKEPTYYIHGTGEIDALGEAASHGCVRMDPRDAEELGRLLMEWSGDYKEPGWFRRIFQSRRSATVRLSEGIPMEVVRGQQLARAEAMSDSSRR